MNFGVIILAIFLVGATIFGVIMAASAHSTAYVDTYGNTTGTATNHTQGIITNATGPAMGAGGGVALLLAAILVFVAVLYLGSKVFGGGGYTTRR
jgi:hypothetical protein